MKKILLLTLLLCCATILPAQIRTYATPTTGPDQRQPSTTPPPPNKPATAPPRPATPNQPPQNTPVAQPAPAPQNPEPAPPVQNPQPAASTPQPAAESPVVAAKKQLIAEGFAVCTTHVDLGAIYCKKPQTKGETTQYRYIDSDGVIIPVEASLLGIAPGRKSEVVRSPVISALPQQGSAAHWSTGQLVDEHNTTNDAQIPFNGSNGDSRGFALTTRAVTEDGLTREVLQMHPKWVDQGCIKGFFPVMVLPQSPRFKASFGFINGATGSDGARFWVWIHHYPGGQETWEPIANVYKKYTGRLEDVDIDLARFAGQKVYFELRIDAGASSGQDWSIWVNPRIEGF